MNENLNTKREGIKKINQMSTQEFLRFLREFVTLFDKNNKLDLSKVTISEKIDGQAIRLIYLNNELYFENSNSGIITWKDMLFKNDYKLIYDCLLPKFQFHFRDKNIKLIGELIWINNLSENNKITPVCASYLTKYFGKLGGMIVFDIKNIKDNQLIDASLADKTKIYNVLSFINDSEFTFYNNKDIVLKNVNFKLDTLDFIKYKLSLPDYNKDRYSVTNDKDIINDIHYIQVNLNKEFERLINNIQGRFSENNDLIEGIVLEVNSSKNQYGIFSENYKQLKKQNCKYSEQKDILISKFYKTVFDYITLSMIKKHFNNDNYNEYNNLYTLYYPQFIEDLQLIYDRLKADKYIPLGTKHAQLLILKKNIETFEQLDTLDKFINRYIK